jgi:hypothetical protein
MAVKFSACFRNPMLYPTELQAPGLLLHRWQLPEVYYAIFNAGRK